MSVNVKNMPQAATLGGIKRLNGQIKKSAAARVPEYLSATGSIFNAPQVKQTTQTQTQEQALNQTKTTQNTQNSQNTQSNKSPNLFGNNSNVNFITSGGKNKETHGTGGIKYTGTNGLTACLDENVQASVSADDITASNATSKMGEAMGKLGSFRSDVGDMQDSGNAVKNSGNRSVQLKKQLDKTDEKFQKTQEKQKKQFEKLQKQQQALLNEMDHNRQDLISLKTQLENELASDKPDQDKIANYRAAISGKTSVINLTGKRIHVISRSSQKLVTQMNKTAKSYKAEAISTQKEQEAEKSTAQKVIETSTKVGIVAQGVQVTGLALKLIAKLLDATGFGAAVGAALEVAGTTLETAGKWGKCASDAVNAVAYAADGQIGMALCSAGSAIATGISAYESTQMMGKEYKALANSSLKKIGGAKGLTAEATRLLGEDAKEAAKDIAGEAAKDGVEEGAKEGAKGAMETLKEVKGYATEISSLGQTLNNTYQQYNQTNPLGNTATTTTKPRTAAQLAQEQASRQNVTSMFGRWGTHRV